MFLARELVCNYAALGLTFLQDYVPFNALLLSYPFSRSLLLHFLCAVYFFSPPLGLMHIIMELRVDVNLRIHVELLTIFEDNEHLI